MPVNLGLSKTLLTAKGTDELFSIEDVKELISFFNTDSFLTKTDKLLSSLFLVSLIVLFLLVSSFILTRIVLYLLFKSVSSKLIVLISLLSVNIFLTINLFCFLCNIN